MVHQVGGTTTQRKNTVNKPETRYLSCAAPYGMRTAVGKKESSTACSHLIFINNVSFLVGYSLPSLMEDLTFLSIPSLQTSGLQNWGRIKFCCCKSPSAWSFVTTATRNSRILQDRAPRWQESWLCDLQPLSAGRWEVPSLLHSGLALQPDAAKKKNVDGSNVARNLKAKF